MDSDDSVVSEGQEQLDLNNPSDNPQINTIYQSKEYNSLQENKAFVKVDYKGNPKLFYFYRVNELMNIQLLEGYLSEYQIHSIGGQKYYPLIIGYEEAKIMRQEGIFLNIGDPIKNFFGKNVVVIGVMKKTNGVLDLAHIMPLNKEEFN